MSSGFTGAGCLASARQLVALFRLMHFGIALFVGVFRRTWSADDRRVHDRSGRDFHATLAKIGVDLAENALAQFVFFE
jgi:hypothetical protein